MRKKAFTLIELLVTISIIGLLTGIFIPAVNRSLNNSLPNDAELLTSKIEYARLLAGSTQQFDASLGNGTGYYGVYLPGTLSDHFNIVRLTSNASNSLMSPCDRGAVLAESPSTCVVEKVNLSSGVQIVTSSGNPELIVFKAPNQQIYDLRNVSSVYTMVQPDSFTSWKTQLKSGSKTATVNIDSTTGKVSSVTYQ